MKKNEDGNKLTTAILKGKGFKKEVQEDRDGDKFTTWYKDGLEIHQSTYSDDFSLATRTREDGSFKSGYNIGTDTQLENLYYALTNKEL